jgi:ATP-binding cassette subfamily B protein
LTSGAIDALQDEIAVRRVSVQLDLVDNDLRVMGDPSILEPVIVELCRNEIVHARPGERIALRVERHNNHVWLSVLGMGDKPAELSASAAQRMEATLASAGGGFTLMPLHGHLAYVAMLPLHPVADAHPQKRPAAPEDDAAPLQDLLVMAIDDQEEARDALEAVLCASGARVQLASSGVQALEWLRRTQTGEWPQLLLCDIVLANEDGYDVLRRIRQLENERAILASLSMPAIALTGYAEREDRARAQQAGFQAHLTKPVPPEKLIVEIRKLAGERTRA